MPRSRAARLPRMSRRGSARAPVIHTWSEVGKPIFSTRVRTESGIRPRRLPEQRLVPHALHFSVGGHAEGEGHQAVVHEGQASLHTVGHRVAILQPEIMGKGGPFEGASDTPPGLRPIPALSADA